MEDMELNNGINTEVAESVAEALPLTTSQPKDHLICLGLGVIGGLAGELIVKPVMKWGMGKVKKLGAKKNAETAAADTEQEQANSTDTPDKEE